MKAARVLRNVSLEQLASRIDKAERLGERTLRALESESSPFDERKLRIIAEALDMPEAWFFAEDLLASTRAEDKPQMCRREFDSLWAEVTDLRRYVESHLDQPPNGDRSTKRHSRPRLTGA